MRLHIEEIAAENRLCFDFVDHYLAAEMFMSEVESHFRDCVCFDLLSFKLAAVILYHFLYFLVNAEEMVFALGNPLLLAVILQLEHSRRNYSMHDGWLYLVGILYPPL